MEYDKAIKIKNGEAKEIELEVKAARFRAKRGTFGRLVQ